jgi:cytoskeletal protein CcmA (bactofilin family)
MTPIPPAISIHATNGTGAPVNAVKQVFGLRERIVLTAGPADVVALALLGRASHRHAGEKREMDMLNSLKGRVPEKPPEKPAAPTAPEVTAAPTVQPQRPVIEPPAPRPASMTKAGTVSCIGSGMSIVGKIDCNGPAQIFGRIEGELRASDLLISEGAQVEGTVIAQEVTVCGRVKGTIRAVRVKLQDGGGVEGDIFHRSLSIDENSLFEGSSRRVENPMDPSSNVDPKDLPKKDLQTPAAAPFLRDLPRVEGSASADWSESTVGPKQ